MVAIKLPPNAGRVCCSRPVSASIESTVQSAVRPVCKRTATPGASSRPKAVADQPGVDLRIVLAQTLVATNQDLVRAGANQMLQVTERTLGVHTDQCHQTATTGIGKLASLAHELVGHGSHRIVLVGLREHPNVSICIKVHRTSGLVTLDRNGTDGAGVDAPAA